MRRLAALFGSFFTSTFGLAASWFSVRAATIAAGVAVTAALTAGLFIGCKALVSNVVMSVPYEPFVMGFWACWPANAETCISACLGADIAVFIYRYKVDLMKVIQG
jgi:hypothetical protein